MIITTDPIDPSHLATCLRTFERQLRKSDDRDTLTPALSTTEVTRSYEPGTVIAEIRNPSPFEAPTTAGASGQGLAGPAQVPSVISPAV